MALSFKKNMFFCWKRDETTESLVGFTSADVKYIYDVRDRLSTRFSNDKDLTILKSEEQPTKPDSIFRLVDKNDEEILHSFLKKKTPSTFATLFKSKRYRDWQKEWHSIMKLVRVSIETSHDFPGLMVNSDVHSPEELSREIKRAFSGLELELSENAELENVNIFENRTFG